MTGSGVGVRVLSVTGVPPSSFESCCQFCSFEISTCVGKGYVGDFIDRADNGDMGMGGRALISAPSKVLVDRTLAGSDVLPGL